MSPTVLLSSEGKKKEHVAAAAAAAAAATGTITKHLPSHQQDKLHHLLSSYQIKHMRYDVFL